tara:strand:- start:1641 stop:2078 length:438 start_codon:yes stop_codon:yes gene_type:complete
MSKKRLQKEAVIHLEKHIAFSRTSSELTRKIEGLSGNYQRLMKKAKTEIDLNLPLALSSGLQGRMYKADLLVALSVRAVVRMNDFYHRLMIIYIEDLLNGIDYNNSQFDSLIKDEYADLVQNSTSATQFEQHLQNLRSEIQGGLI